MPFKSSLVDIAAVYLYAFLPLICFPRMTLHLRLTTIIAKHLSISKFKSLNTIQYIVTVTVSYLMMGTVIIVSMYRKTDRSVMLYIV